MRTSYVISGLVAIFSGLALAASDLPFQSGQTIRLKDDHSPYQLTLRNQRVQSEGETMTEYHLLASKDGQTWYDLVVDVPSDEVKTSDGIWEVQYIDVVSSDYQDAAGIHIGSSVRDFYAAYPQAQAYYGPESNLVWLTRGRGIDPNESVSYFVPISSYQAKMIADADVVRLRADGFADDATINRITIW